MKAPLPVYVIHWNAADRAIRSVSSLLTTERVEVAITVIDNASRPEEYEALERGLARRVRLVRLTSNIGFAGAANYALSATGDWPDAPEFLVIAAHDVMVEPDTLSKLLHAAAGAERVGVLGPSLWEPGFRRHRNGVETGREDRSRDPAGSPLEGVAEADWVSGALCLFRRRCLLELGGFDERLFSYYEDVDVCLRARRAGWIVGHVPEARAVEVGHTVDDFSRVYLISRNHLLVTRWRRGRWTFVREAARLGRFSARAWIGSALPTRCGDRRARSRLFARAQWKALTDAIGRRDGSPLWLDAPQRARTRSGWPDLEAGHASDFVALLGRRDVPTDGVEDYCRRLAEALLARQRLLEPRRVPWPERGWWRALWWLWRESARWGGKWVVVQYTAMGWSRRGFPVGLLAVLWILCGRQCQIAVMFHDPCGFPGRRWIDRARRGIQQWVMRRAYERARRTISNIPLDRVGWLPRASVKAVSIPVGSNVGPTGPRPDPAEGTAGRGRTVAVFGVTGGESGEREVAVIARAVRRAAQTAPGLRLIVMGRGASEAEGALRKAMDGVDVALTVLGVLPADDVCDLLSGADVLLFVRGALSGQRTSGIAGIACGLPVVGYAGSETGAPITEAGVMLVPPGNDEALGAALTRVLTDGELRRRLRQQSAEAYRRYFSWDAIAERFVEALPR